MHLTIHHTTRYTYSEPGSNAVQRLRLTPPNTKAQKILNWTIDAPGIEKAAVHTDGAGNLVHLISQTEPENELVITAYGEAETTNTDGICGPDPYPTNPRVYLNSTQLTESSEAIDDMASKAHASAGARGDLAVVHELMHRIAEIVTYDTDTTHAGTSAHEAFEAGSGVCQDHAHILIAAGRFLEIPVRYVTGYMHVAGEDPAVAHHAWAEAHINDLGWVGFDPANEICPTEHYLRLACGFDTISAAPVTGLRKGSADETLAVDVTVKQQQQ